jgi:hypothetical protein
LFGIDSFVEVFASGLDDDGNVIDVAGNQVAGVSGDGADGEMGDGGIGECDGGVDFFGEGAEAAPGDDANGGDGIYFFLEEGGGFFNVFEMVVGHCRYFVDLTIKLGMQFRMTGMGCK